MSRKSFKAGFDTLLGEEISSKETKLNNKNISIKKEIRATFLVDMEQHEKLKAISFWERKHIKTALNEALEAYINKYEEVNGKIKLPE